MAKRFLISGRVQGVFYRASTRAKAQELGLCGYAKNLADGRVEVLAVGSNDAVVLLEKWLWQGPPAAQVLLVEAAEVELDEAPQGFITR